MTAKRGDGREGRLARVGSAIYSIAIANTTVYSIRTSSSKIQDLINQKIKVLQVIILN